MKRIVALVLVIAMCFPLSACSFFTKKTKLTIENFNKYLKLNIVCQGNGDGVESRDSIVWYPEIKVGFSVTGASSNFNYNDIVVEIEFSGTYDACRKINNFSGEAVNKPFKMTVTVEADIAGNGELFETIKLAEDFFTKNAFIDCKCTVTSVSGNVTPAW